MTHPISVDGWYQANIRNGVYQDGRVDLSDEFVTWKSRCFGRVAIQMETPQNEFLIPRIKIYFEHQEDLVNYLLTFDPIQRQKAADIAAFYCPYVPLTTTSVATGRLPTDDLDLDKNG